MFIISGLLFAARFLLLDYATLLLGKLSPSLPGSLAFSIKHRKAGSWELQQLFAAAAIPFILVYNGSRGIELRNKISAKIYQYSFYAFYPLHLLLLSFLFGKK
ncbi:unknown [Anaerotruncus sp. CAG:390]|nr:unknown [Anaerotruncus sp. CAG:390]